MNFWQAVILGLVEGITEYLPVSSTGHLIITASLLGLDGDDRKQAIDAFNIIIQGGAILAVIGLYFPRILRIVNGLLGRDKAGFRLAMHLLIAFLPAAILGVLFNDFIESHLFSTVPVLAALFLGGVWMIALDRWRERRLASASDEEKASVGRSITELTWSRALAIGLFQCVAMWPGTSRSMMTIAGGTLLGLKPKEAAEFSFLLGLPTLGGACVYKLGTNILDARETGRPNLFEELGLMPVVVGVVVATIAAALAIRWLVSFLNRHGLKAFGWYRIGLCIVLGTLIAAGVVTV